MKTKKFTLLLGLALSFGTNAFSQCNISHSIDTGATHNDIIFDFDLSSLANSNGFNVQLSFTDLSNNSIVGNANITNANNPYQANFSDGTYMYQGPIQDGLGCVDSLTGVFIVGPSGGGTTPSPCNASYSYTSDSSNMNFTFMVTQPSATATYEWNFGDGSNNAFGSPVNHSYTTNGTYIVTLIVTDGNCSDSLSQSVYVGGSSGPAPCQAAFTITQDTANPTIFYAYSTAIGTSFYWDFGDGNTSTLQHPTHTYSAAGTYTVCLTATDSTLQCVSIVCDTINVTVPGASMYVIPPGAAGINDIDHNSQLQLYPNPNNGNFLIQFNSTHNSSLNFEIIDLSGRVVYNEQLQTNIGNNIIDIKTNQLEAGVYVYRLGKGKPGKITIR